MASRAHRFPEGNTPLSAFHGGGLKAAIRAVKDARSHAEWEARGCPPSPSAAPKKRDKKRPSAESRSSLRSLVERITEYQLGRCILCSTPIDLDSDYDPQDPRRASFDHVLPKSRGGLNVGNYLVAHRKCNGDKADRLPTGCELVWLAAVNAHLNQTAECAA